LSDPALHAALESLGSNQAFDIAYHTWWPSGTDPFYLANQAENNARIGYYSITGTPTQKCDGATIPGPTQMANILASINGRLNVPSPLWMNLTGLVTQDSIILTCQAVADRNVSGNVSIHFLMLDRYSYLPNSPNGQPHHYHAMWDMAPTASGQSFSATALDTVYYSAAFYRNPSWVLENLDMACFVQDNADKEVLQATYASLPLDFPNLILAGFDVYDHVGNGDGRVDPGETGRMSITLENMVPFHDATQVVGKISTAEPLIQVTDSVANFPDIPSGATGNNDADPLEFVVDPGFVTHEVTFTVAVTAEPGSFEAAYDIEFMVGRPDLLVVNDDIAGNYESFYVSALDSLGIVHDVWNQSQAGSIPQQEIAVYEYVIWYTGLDNTSVLDDSDQAAIGDYLNGGGRLLLSSQNAGDVLQGTAFYQNVLHAQHLANSVGLDFPLHGVEGDPISDGTTLYPIGPGGAGNSNSCASFNPISPAVGIYTYNNTGTFGALRCEFTPYKLIYCAFPVEALSGLSGSLTRWQFLDLCLAYLESPAGIEAGSPFSALPEQLGISRLSPNPFNPSTEIQFSLPWTGQATIVIYDLQGRMVRELANRNWMAGYHSVMWDAVGLSSGIYWATLESRGKTAAAKALLLK
jgi:hypothetical protein